MGVQVRLPTMLRKHVAGQSVIQAGGGTVGSLLTELGQHYPGLHTDLTGPDGELHQFINIYVNDEDIRYLDGLSTAVGAGDVVSILPAVAGGRAGSQGCWQVSQPA